MSGDLTLLLLAVLLVVLAAVLSCVEAATARVTKVALEGFQREGRDRTEQLAQVLADPVRSLNLLLLLRTAAETCAACCAAVAVVHHSGQGFRSVSLAAAVMTVASYVVIGVAGRTIGRQRAADVALRFAPLVLGLTRALSPVARLLILVGNAVTPGRGYRDGPFASEAELRDLVDRAQASGVVERAERDMIAGALDLGETLVREVMVPRPDIVFIERTKTVRQALALALRSGFSRVPVIGEHIDDVVGVTYLKDLARRAQDGREEERVDSAMRPPSYVPDSKPVDELLREMQADQTHLALVVDEYGGTAGVVTIEDIIEEVVGEITDEYDREMPPVEDLGDGRVRVTSRLPVSDLAELFDVEIEVDGVETVGGLLANELGRVPIPGATVEVNGLRLVAESAKGRRNRIGTVLVERTADEAAERQ